MVKQQRTKKISKNTELSKIRHSTSHILAEAVLNLYSDTKLGIGPAIDDGFYYDFEFKKPITDADLLKIESEMIRLINEGRIFKRSSKTIPSALNWGKKNKQPYKIELIKDLRKAGHKKLSFYTSLRAGGPKGPAAGNFTDLCEGPHLKNTKEIGAFKLLSLAGAYWRGDENNPQLTRIYGTAFTTKKELNEYLKWIEEAKKRDHRLLGEHLDLFSFHPEGPGFPFWHSKGQFLFNKIIEYMRGILKDNDYQEVSTPLILNEELWHKSGHWDNYKENMYFTKIDNKNYVIRPMNCPGNILVFNKSLRSYKELPLRMAEFGLVYRHELSGVLHGLFRARAFTQDDAHIYCAPDQIKTEIKALINMVQKVYKDFGFNNYCIELSTRPQKSIGSNIIWNKAEKIMKEVIKEEKLDVTINKGEGAFYGPKLDFHIQDSLGRSWQLGTIQLDFSMPEKLGASYVDKDGKKKTPVIIHRTILGSLERFIAILIEHYEGALPCWLAPIQTIVLPISDKQKSYAQRVTTELEQVGLRVKLDDRNESLNKKIRDAELQKIPDMLIVGPKEAKTKKIAIRNLQVGDLGKKSLIQTIKRLSNFYSPQ